MQVMVTDITLGAGTSTAPLPVIQFLNANGVKVMVDNAVTSLLVTKVKLSAVACGGQMLLGRSFCWSPFACTPTTLRTVNLHQSAEKYVFSNF